MVAQLGEIVFELLKSPSEISEVRKWEWAEHRGMDVKPRLQKMGQGLTEISMNIKLSVFLGFDPQAMIDKLSEEADKETSVPFILGNGRIIGEFVITEIQINWKRTDNYGNLVTAELSVKLKEYN